MASRMYDGGDRLFLAACKLAGVQPTRRQWRKWQRHEGSAYKVRDEAAKQLAG